MQNLIGTNCNTDTVDKLVPGTKVLDSGSRPTCSSLAVWYGTVPVPGRSRASMDDLRARK